MIIYEKMKRFLQGWKYMSKSWPHTIGREDAIKGRNLVM
jgi:hypothetical protein